MPACRSSPWRTSGGGPGWRRGSCACARTGEAWTPTVTGTTTGARRRRVSSGWLAKLHRPCCRGHVAGGCCRVRHRSACSACTQHQRDLHGYATCVNRLLLLPSIHYDPLLQTTTPMRNTPAPLPSASPRPRCCCAWPRWVHHHSAVAAGACSVQMWWAHVRRRRRQTQSSYGHLLCSACRALSCTPADCCLPSCTGLQAARVDQRAQRHGSAVHAV